MEDATTVVESRITRRQLGIDMNLEGFALDNIAVEGKAMFRNPFGSPGNRMKTSRPALVVESMGQWVRGQGSGPYPLAEGYRTT